MQSATVPESASLPWMRETKLGSTLEEIQKGPGSTVRTFATPILDTAGNHGSGAEETVGSFLPRRGTRRVRPR
jgi:hypothetical protein